MNKLNKIILSFLIFFSLASVVYATVLGVGQGGTALQYPTTGFQTGTCLTGNGLSAIGTTTCGSGGTGTVSTSTNETSGFLSYWTSNSATPALLGKVATSSLSASAPITFTGTAGALVGGTSLTINCTSASSGVTGCLTGTDWNTFNGKQTAGNYITGLTGDGTASGPGSVALTLATVNANTGSFGGSTAIPNFTVNGKGLITAAGTNVVIAPAGTLSGTTLNSTVVTSSLTSASLATLTATDGTLTFSGSYNGNTARTVGLNLGNANTWTGQQIFSSANVGIGSTTPWGLLSVNANGLAAGTPQFVVGSSTATNFIVANNGNVGVGTTSPSQKLSVNGQAFASSFNSYSPATAFQINGVPVIQSITGNNFFIGLNAGAAGVTGTGNYCIGNACENNLGTGFNNIALGTNALNQDTGGMYNTAMGNNSLQLDTGGYYNTAVGASTLFNNQNGAQNVAIGMNAGDGGGAYSADNNTFVGSFAGQSISNGGSSNTLIGGSTGGTLTTGSSNILLGFNVDVPASGTSNYLSIGNLIYGNLSTGLVGIGTSTPYATLSIQSGASTGDAFAVATSSGNAIGGYDNDGHRFTSGPAPVISSCGTGTGTVVGDDQGGVITTATTATACTLTFSKAYRFAPYCTASDNSLAGFADISTISTAAITFGISAPLTAGKIYYSCAYHK